MRWPQKCWSAALTKIGWPATQQSANATHGRPLQHAVFPRLQIAERDDNESAACCLALFWPGSQSGTAKATSVSRAPLLLCRRSLRWLNSTEEVQPKERLTLSFLRWPVEKYLQPQQRQRHGSRPFPRQTPGLFVECCCSNWAQQRLPSAVHRSARRRQPCKGCRASI